MKSLSDEKLQRELLAQKKRVEALKYLASQGQGIDTETVMYKKSVRNASQTDNTLELLRKEKINSGRDVEQTTKNILIQQQERLRIQVSENSNNLAGLPANWEKVLDTKSSLYYYWNRLTNETTWEKPSAIISSNVESGQATSSSAATDDGSPWKEEIHSASRQTYWVNKITGEKSFENPANRKSAATLAVSSVASTTTAATAKRKLENTSNTHNKTKKAEIDPLDPTAGKEEKGRFADGKMADSTASGPLWQQRPYPAPGKALENKPKTNVANIVGPVFVSAGNSKK